MHRLLSTLLAPLKDGRLQSTAVIPWGCPVPVFGDIAKSRVATLGLNPSNREFVDASGEELVGNARRFHTLRSLGIEHWSDVNARHLKLIGESCRTYFSKNPYDGWFKRLDRIISKTDVSYYGTSAQACHLDLIPYATACKWTGLSREDRAALEIGAGDVLGQLLRDSPVRVLILNGKSVVESFERIAGVSLRRRAMPSWALPRQSQQDVMGFAYTGCVRRLADTGLNRDIVVLGFNHNIQSSFGVTNSVIAGIRTWIGRASRGLSV